MKVNNQTVEMLKMTKPYTMVCQCLRSFLPSSSSSWRCPFCLAFATWMLLTQLASCSLNVSSSAAAAAGHASLSNSSISFLRGRHGGGSSSGFPKHRTGNGSSVGANDGLAAETNEGRQLLLQFNLYQNPGNLPPGAMAALWQERDPKVSSYTEERNKQRLALATFYYATRGDNWLVNTGWLSYDIDEVSKKIVILFLEMLLVQEQTECRAYRPVSTHIPSSRACSLHFVMILFSIPYDCVV